MPLCFNRGYVKQMAALLLQVISVGTTINFVVPYCCRCGTALTCRAEILLKPPFEVMIFWTKGILTMQRGSCKASLSTFALGDTRAGAASSTSSARAPMCAAWWDVQCLGSGGDGAVCFDISKLENSICLWFFLIKWMVRSSFISFLD